jgi:hypothetical protein
MSNESTGTVSTIFEEVSLLPKGRCVIGGREFELEAIRLLLGQAKDVAPNVVAVSALSFIIYANYYSKFDLVTFLESPSRGRDLTAELQRHNHGRKELQLDMVPRVSFRRVSTAFIRDNESIRCVDKRLK